MGCKVSFFAVVASTLSLQSLATNYDALGYPDENGNFVLTEEGRKFWGRTPKTLGFFTIFGFDRASRQLRRGAKGRVRRGDFSMVRIRLARFALPQYCFGLKQKR